MGGKKKFSGRKKKSRLFRWHHRAVCGLQVDGWMDIAEGGLVYTDSRKRCKKIKKNGRARMKVCLENHNE